MWQEQQSVHNQLPSRKFRDKFIRGCEALFRFVRIKARFMRQREKYFIQHRKTVDIFEL